MKLLILTQILDVNDPNLGFFHDWILEFSKGGDKVYVICLKQGEYHLPNNVEVFSLGKEDGVSRIKYIFRFYKYIFSLAGRYDNVFVHMSQIYVLMGGWFWRLWGKKIGLWYAHGKVSSSLKIASFFTNFIFTSSDKGCRLDSSKVKILGQGINTELFKPDRLNRVGPSPVAQLLSIGRISSVKNYDLLLEAALKLVNLGTTFRLFIVGSPITVADVAYEKKLKESVRLNKMEESVVFCGGVKQEKIRDFLKAGDVLINLSNTGSIDKAVLEAMSSGILVITSNVAFKGAPVALDKQGLFLDEVSADGLSKKIREVISLSPELKDRLRLELRETVIRDHNLVSLISKVLSFLN